mgnify:CR=1 FL=1
MRPELLQDELIKILDSGTFGKTTKKRVKDDYILSLTEDQMFKLWNILGEELGIDLSLATDDQRKMLFESCKNGKHAIPQAFSSLLWLVYYGDMSYQ